MGRLRIQLKVDAFADLSVDCLLNPGQFGPEHIDIEAEVCDDLVSLLLVHCAEPIQVGLRGSYFAGHAQAQNFLILLFNDLFFFLQVLSELVESMLDVLHVLFDPLHVDSTCLLGAVVSQRSHWTTGWIEVTATALIKERRLYIGSIGELLGLLGDKLGRIQAPLVLLFQHVDFKIVMFLQEVDLIFDPPRRLLYCHLLILCLGIKLSFQLFVLLLQRFKDFFLVVQFGLKAFRHLLELFNVLLHVGQKYLLLVLLLVFIVRMAALLRGHILLELIKE